MTRELIVTDRGETRHMFTHERPSDGDGGKAATSKERKCRAVGGCLDSSRGPLESRLRSDPVPETPRGMAADDGERRRGGRGRIPIIRPCCRS